MNIIYCKIGDVLKLVFIVNMYLYQQKCIQSSKNLSVSNICPHSTRKYFLTNLIWFFEMEYDFHKVHVIVVAYFRIHVKDGNDFSPREALYDYCSLTHPLSRLSTFCHIQYVDVNGIWCRFDLPFFLELVQTSLLRFNRKSNMSHFSTFIYKFWSINQSFYKCPTWKHIIVWLLTKTSFNLHPTNWGPFGPRVVYSVCQVFIICTLMFLF